MPLFPKIPNELLISHGEKPRSHGSRWRMVQWSGEPGWLASRGCSWDHAEILHMFTQILDTRKAWSMFSPDACDQSQDLALVRIQMHNPLFVWRFLQLMEDIWMFHRSSYSSPCDHQLVAWWCAKQGMSVFSQNLQQMTSQVCYHVWKKKLNTSLDFLPTESEGLTGWPLQKTAFWAPSSWQKMAGSGSFCGGTSCWAPAAWCVRPVAGKVEKSVDVVRCLTWW